MGCLTTRSPASWTDCLDMGASRACARKAFLWMRATGDSMAILDGEDLLAIAFLKPDAAGRLEFALAIRPLAACHMRTLVRLAHLTLRQISDTGMVIICHVMTGNRTGERMARLAGFIPDGGTMVFRRVE